MTWNPWSVFSYFYSEQVNIHVWNNNQFSRDLEEIADEILLRYNSFSYLI